MSSLVHRRALLRSAAAAAGTLWLPRSAWTQPRLSNDPFTLGVASGSARHDGVVLWTRLHDAGVFGGSRLPDAASRCAGKSPTTKRLRGSCSKARYRRCRNSRTAHGHFSAWRHLVDDAPDAVLFLGDYIYEYPTSANPVRPGAGNWVLTLADYRQRYAQYKSDADLQAAHAACPWFVTWDDHEVQNDYAGLTVGENGPAVADFAARRAAAYQAFYEHMPLRASALTRALAGLTAGAEVRLYGDVRFGRLATLTLLDARQYRSAQVCTRGGQAGSSRVDPQTCATWMDPARSCSVPSRNAGSKNASAARPAKTAGRCSARAPCSGGATSSAAKTASCGTTAGTATRRRARA
jgi:alkaline phosphatase D